MIALDTNVLARFYVEDVRCPQASEQRKIALRIMQRSPSLYVAHTVVLEPEWVMRGLYGFDVGPIARAFEHLLGLPNVTVEDRDLVESALERMRQGVDFADALHLAASHHCSEMVTFDSRRFAKRSNRLGLKPRCSVPLR
jgi:predicted nucleic-acid-binding protein